MFHDKYLRSTHNSINLLNNNHESNETISEQIQHIEIKLSS